jgi:hypothetical protein
MCGYPVARTKQGRVVTGVRYKNPLEYLPRTATSAVPEGESIVAVMQNEAKSDTFHIVTGQEVMAVCRQDKSKTGTKTGTKISRDLTVPSTTSRITGGGMLIRTSFTPVSTDSEDTIHLGLV